jgi:acylphosphatase
MIGMIEKSSLQAYIQGRVQGVFFRAFVLEKAKLLDIAGYVRNLPNGHVEVRAEGTKANLEKLIDYLKVGPPAAQVVDIKIQWSKYRGKYSHFIIQD